jgi:hypothetical protein
MASKSRGTTVEHRPRLVADLAAAVARGHMRQREQAHLGVPRQPGRVPGGRVSRLHGAIALLLGERGLVDEQVRPVRGDPHGVGRCGVAGDDQLAPRPRRAHDLIRRHPADRLAALQPPEVRPGHDAQALRLGRVEFTGALVLPQHPGQGRDAVLDADGRQRVTVAAHLGTRLHLLDRQLVAHPAVDRTLHDLHQLAQAARPPHGERALAVAQVEGLEHARKPQPVVGMEVREQHLVDVGQADRAHELALRPLAAVEQQPVAAATHEHRGHPPAGGGYRTAGAGEEHVEIHGRGEVRG